MFSINRSNFSILIIVIIGVISKIAFAEYPDDPKPCPYGDSDCLVKIINYFTKEKSKGDDNINLVQIDPLKVGKMSIKQGAESAVNIDLTFTDNELYGLQDATVYKVKGFDKDLTKKKEIFVKFKTVSLVGDYTIKGRVLVLPISGSGKSNITMIDTEMVLSFKGEPVEKDGETYMKVKDTRIRFKPSKLEYYFGNLFNGDKVLGDNMNAFLNENWKDIFHEVDGSVAAAFSRVFQKLVNFVFEKYPYNKYFTE